MARPIDADGSYTLNECNETGHRLSFGGGFVDVYDPRGKHICQFWAGDAPTVDAVEVVQRWIPVSERLPEEVFEEGYDEEPHTASDLVLVAVMDETNRRFVADDIIFDGKWVNFPCPEFEITHWMPLPEPPEGE